MLETVAPPPDAMHVMAGVMQDTRGRVLLAQRPAGKHLAGFWEFPGGKVEPGEQPLIALQRELREELGIVAVLGSAKSLISLPWRYQERRLLLDAWRVDHWEGTPASLESQALQWVLPERIDIAILAPADRAILQALRLPCRYVITPAEPAPEQAGLWFERIRNAIDGGERLLQLRLPRWSSESVRNLASELRPAARERGAELVLNGDIDGALALGVGVHLNSHQLMAATARPLPWGQLVGASCHDALQLRQAADIGADFATLSPVSMTLSHPQARPLGWTQFQAMVAQASLPVYALGGMAGADLAHATELGGQGVAGIRGFWAA